MIPGTFIGLQGNPAIYGLFTENRGQGTGASSFSFTNCNIGAASSTRIIALTVNYWEFDTSVNLNSVTVGGVSLTQRVVVSRGLGSENGYAAIWSGVVPTGTTATISLTFSRLIERGCDIGIWALSDANSSTPVTTTSATASGNTAINLSRNVEANDFALVAASGFYGATAAFAYTNATERYDLRRRSGDGDAFEQARSGADFVALSPQVDRTVTITPTGLNFGSAACMAIWR